MGSDSNLNACSLKIGEDTTGSKAMALRQASSDTSFPNQLIKHMSDLTKPRSAHSHDYILSELLGKIEVIDFREKAGLANDEKPKQNHFLIITIEEILSLAKKYDWGICRKHDFIYLYNGAYWKKINIDDLKSFLGEASEKLGVEKFKARHYRFRDELYKQFMTTAVLPTLQETNKVKINLLNGTFEVDEGQINIKPFDRKDFLIYQLTFKYDPNAGAPRFMEYLNKVLPDIEVQNVVSEYLGYIFISQNVLKLEKVMLMYGTGANGKSVLFDIINAIFGKENLCSYSLQSLTDDKGYHRAKLADKLINYASEINGKLEASLFKQMVSGEPVEARLPHRDPFIMEKYAKLVFNTNELPINVEHTHAYFRRFLIVPFNVTIPVEDQDNRLADKIIKSELSGVYNWILDGMKRLLKQTEFSICRAAEREVIDFKTQSDSVKLFLDEYGYQKDISIYYLMKDLYREYSLFCSEDGFSRTNKKNFRKRLEAIGIDIRRKNNGNVVFVGKKI
jgi:putative DNA primase/helicase